MSDAESDDDSTAVPHGSQLVWRPPVTPAAGARTPVASILAGLRPKHAFSAKAADEMPRLSVFLVNPQDHNTSLASNPGRSSRYLPLCSASVLGRGHAKNDLTILPSCRERIDSGRHQESQYRTTWPAYEVPKEIFDLITQHLARDDVKNMRLVDQEFENKVSSSLFQNAVVPFNTELYDMIDDEAKTMSRQPIPKPKQKGKGKARMTDTSESTNGLVADGEHSGLNWQNAKDDKEGKLYKGHGLKVFQGFGPHIKRFGMSFEVSEDQLSRPPAKKELDEVDAYHGAYNWPPPFYARFDNLAGLERTADETSRMKAAFSNLEIVQELGISIDSGLGWLSGLDASVRARVFERPTPVFGSSFGIPDHQAQAATDFWAALQQSQAASELVYNAKEVTVVYSELSMAPTELEGLKGRCYANARCWSAIDSTRIMPDGLPTRNTRFGAIYTTPAQLEPTMFFGANPPVVPNGLKKDQKEWLLETEWAQRAFLESYMLAIVDNPIIFENVTTLNIAKLSSSFLPMIGREHFWDALPCLINVTLHVKPDWRSVAKDDAGFAEITTKSPSDAVRLFYAVLGQHIATLETLEKLNIGWVGGGEHAEGMFARNGSILPAPLTQLEQSTASNSITGLVFKHLEHLTLTNCWITPPALDGLIRAHAGHSLKKLTLASVSLTAHPRHQAGAQQAQAQAQQMAQLIQQVPLFQLPGQNAAPLQWGGNVNALQPQAQQLFNQQVMLQMQQQMLLANQQAQNLNLQANVQPNPPANFFNNANFPPLPAAPMQAQAQVAAFQGFVPPPPPPPGAPVAVPANPVVPQPTNWTDGHREGSWTDMLNNISPGPILTDYLEQPQPWEDPLPDRPATKLETIEFISCGYAKLLHHAPFDQTALEDWQHQHQYMQSTWFRVRAASLKPHMMETRDRYIAQIVQYMPWRELNALQLAWGLSQGWQDRDEAEKAEWDGFLPGGTGRFSGVVQKGMPLVSALQSDDNQ